MSTHASNSIMQEVTERALNFVKIFQCSRRKHEMSPEKNAIGAARRNNCPLKHAANYDSDDTSLSTEPGEVSSNEFSDRSSYTDSSIPGSNIARRATRAARPATSLKTPPGLHLPPGLAKYWAPEDHASSGLNAGAPCFVPSSQRQQPKNSQQLRHSIQQLKGVLEEWEANLPPPATEVPVEAGESHALLAALAKLTPEEAATVRSMLDNKLGFHNAAPPVAQRLPAWTPQSGAPNRTQRPFVPFGGARPPRDQGKCLKTQNVVDSDAPDDSLRTQLRDLASVDDARVLMLRRINRLGLTPTAELKKHFSQFGEVERVLVAPTRSKGQYGSGRTRVRPAPLGFLVMSRIEEAAAALASGEEHVIEGHAIGVFAFTSHSVNAEE